MYDDTGKTTLSKHGLNVHNFIFLLHVCAKPCATAVMYEWMLICKVACTFLLNMSYEGIRLYWSIIRLYWSIML
jgi:hypothetical protein